MHALKQSVEEHKDKFEFSVNDGYLRVYSCIKSSDAESEEAFVLEILKSELKGLKILQSHAQITYKLNSKEQFETACNFFFENIEQKYSDKLHLNYEPS